MTALSCIYKINDKWKKFMTKTHYLSFDDDKTNPFKKKKRKKTKQ